MIGGGWWPWPKPAPTATKKKKDRKIGKTEGLSGAPATGGSGRLKANVKHVGTLVGGAY